MRRFLRPVRRAGALALLVMIALPCIAIGQSGGVIGAGAVTPTGLSEIRVGASLTEVTAVLGPPQQCGWSDDCAQARNDIVGYPSSMEARISASGMVERFAVYSRAWSAPAGVRVGATVRSLRSAFGARLRGVRNEHPLARRLPGGQMNFMVRDGAYAMGYVTRRGRVSGVLTGTPTIVRGALRTWGPAP
jgi:hypothetical protein